MVSLDRPRILIGRDPGADWPVPSPQASWHHCEIAKTRAGTVVRDLGSTNGTFVNGVRVAAQRITEGDVLSVAGVRLRFSEKSLHSELVAAEGRIDAVRLTQRLARNSRVLLDEVSFTIQPNQLVAIVGASGAGKSTLLNAITGFRPATEGWVLLDGVSLYDHLDELKTRIGYVPQDDIVCPELTVERVLWHAARLRLPMDTTEEEILDRIAHALIDLGLTHRADSVVKTLSGGERKRVNVAVELLGDPRFLCLDEPTTGLDPGNERQIMELLARLCSQGRTVILVTHATESITLCDRVLFLAPGGVPAYYGPPGAAPEFFGVSDFAAIYNKIHRCPDPHELRRAFASSELHKRFVFNQITVAKPADQQVPAYENLTRAVARAWHQFRVLAMRYQEEMLADRRNLMLLLLQAPVIATLTVLLFRQDPFQANQHIEQARFSGKTPIQSAPTLLFILTLTCIWCGTNNAAREIVKEARMFRRERMAGLGDVPYLSSKWAVLGLLSAIQALALWAIVEVGIGFHLDARGDAVLLGWIVLSTLCGMSLGLLVSCVAKSPDQAGSVLPILLVPQVLLGGLMIPLEEMGGVQALSGACPSRWSFAGLASAVDLEGRFGEAGVGNLVKEAFQTPAPYSIFGLFSLSVGFALTSALILRYDGKLRT
jgi:ABC-type multidrug transport system ATPase subunit/ABC-type multidrug transport system permease subunit